MASIPTDAQRWEESTQRREGDKAAAGRVQGCSGPDRARQRERNNALRDLARSFPSEVPVSLTHERPLEVDNTQNLAPFYSLRNQLHCRTHPNFRFQEQSAVPGWAPRGFVGNGVLVRRILGGRSSCWSLCARAFLSTRPGFQCSAARERDVYACAWWASDLRRFRLCPVGRGPEVGRD